jgi:putative phosphonate metabolism protein
MDGYRRYAIYVAPEPGPLARIGAEWLGWDAEAGAAVVQPEVAGLPRPLAELTARPQKYGFHGTIKPPFRLAAGTTPAELDAALAALCRGLAPVVLPGLRLERLGGFLALTPAGDAAALGRLAAEVVRGLDGFRAPNPPEEIARRRPERLTPRQRALLERWGYPYVMEEFRFHMTLTGDLPAAEAEAVAAVLGPLLAPALPRPFRIGSLCLFGEAADGRFRLMHRYTLSG